MLGPSSGSLSTEAAGVTMPAASTPHKIHESGASS